MTRTRLSVVVPTRDRPVMLDRCLASLRAALDPADELIVVDSASTDGPAVAAVAARYNARILRCDEAGTCRARNLGWRSAGHDLVAFVDDDVWVAPSWADAVVWILSRFPEASFVTGRVDLPPHQDRVSRPVAIMDGAVPLVLDRSTRGTFGHSANLAVRKTALEQVGGFDEALGPGTRLRAAEDLDLFDRLFAAGLQGRYEPAALGWHDQWRERWTLVRLDWAYGIGQGGRLAKLMRADRSRAATAARTAFWDWGVATLPRMVRHLDKGPILMTLVRMSGTFAGMARALPVPLRDGHLRPRSSAPA
jgi:glycosyltransferase involved in cell wall biosynthesis